jgi:hypothetical protein
LGPKSNKKTRVKNEGLTASPPPPFFSRERRAVAKTSMKTRRFFRGLSETEISKVGFIFDADAGGDEKTRLFLEKRQKHLFLPKETA